MSQRAVDGLPEQATEEEAGCLRGTARARASEGGCRPHSTGLGRRLTDRVSFRQRGAEMSQRAVDGVPEQATEEEAGCRRGT